PPRGAGDVEHRPAGRQRRPPLAGPAHRRVPGRRPRHPCPPAPRRLTPADPAERTLPTTAFPHRGLDPIRGGGDRLVLPDPDHRPARGAEGLVDGRVALLVPGQLLLPELFVGAGHGAVLGAGVPEAAV